MTLDLLPVRSKSHKRVHFGSCSGDDSSIALGRFRKGLPVWKGWFKASFSLVQPTKHFSCFIPKWGVVYALHKCLISIFSKLAEASSPQIHTTTVVTTGIYVLIGNDAISHFRSAANRVKADADFTVTKRSFGKISETIKTGSFEVHRHIALHSPRPIPIALYVCCLRLLRCVVWPNGAR